MQKYRQVAFQKQFFTFRGDENPKICRYFVTDFIDDRNTFSFYVYEKVKYKSCKSISVEVSI
jgi:hypothetical protein